MNKNNLELFIKVIFDTACFKDIYLISTKVIYLHPLGMVLSISLYFLRKMSVIHSSIETEKTEIFMTQF